MSLFVGKLAFHDAGVELAVKIGVYSGSVASALVGLTILALVHRHRAASALDEADIFTGGGDAGKIGKPG